MKFIVDKLVVFMIAFSIGFTYLTYSQEKDDTILEKVAVVNVEVPVRVVYKRKPVKDLKRSDFKIYEDGKLQNINAFFQIRKKINIQRYELSAEKREKIVYPLRYFVMIFNLIDYSRNLKEGLDYTFNNILKENDQLLVIVNDESVFFNALSKRNIILEKIGNLLKEKGKIAKNRLIELFNRLNRVIIEFKTATAKDSRSSFVPDVLKEYKMIWEIFKRDYLRVDVDNFYYFARHLQKIQKEKFVIHFHQSVQFPFIKFNSISSMAFKQFVERNTLRIQKMNLMFKTRSATEFPSEEVSKLFYRVNAIFHLILIPTRINSHNQDLEFKEVSTAMEYCFREITKKTGGTLVSSADLVTALNTISKKEDIYYMLTYRPENPEKVGKIKVEVLDNKHHYKVQYDKNIRADYIKDYLERKKTENPEIKIKKIHFKDRILYLEVKDFLLKRLKKETSGQVDLWVRVENNDREILYDKHKKLNPMNKTASIQIDFNWLKQGKYYFFMEVSDELTGKSYPEYIQAEISETKTRLKRVEFKMRVEFDY